MKIGFVAGEYPPIEGGVGAFTQEISRALVAQGHRVFIFTRAAARRSNEDAIHICPMVEGAWGWRTIVRIYKWAVQNKLDVLNIQFQAAAYNMHPSIHFVPGFAHLRAPILVTFHDLRVPYLFPKAGILRKWIVRKLAQDSAGVIATDHVDQAVLSGQWGIQHVQWIPIGSNIPVSLPADYNRTTIRSTLGIDHDQLLISYFGFLNESKGVDILIKALSQTVEGGVDAHLVMIGGRTGGSDPANVSYCEMIDQLIVETNLTGRIHWTGFVSNTDVSRLFYASDLTVLHYLDGASLRRGTLMAALTHGRAIITTTPQTDLSMIDNAVVYVNSGDVETLAAQIRALWRDPKRRSSLEKAARKVSGKFAWDSIAQKTLEFYSDIIASENPTSERTA